MTNLVHDLGRIVAQVLIARGDSGGTTAQPTIKSHELYVDRIPQTAKDRAIAIRTDESFRTSRDLSGRMYELPTIHVTVRGLPNNRENPRDVLLHIDTTLAAISGIEIELGTRTYRVQSFSRLGAILPINPDTSQRYIWAAGYCVTVTDIT